MHGFHHDGGPRGHGLPPMFAMAGRMPGFAAAAGARARRGDIRTAVLRLLAEQPMHGYQIIQELSTRSGGVWNPSAGSIYPTLQQLADEGLVDSEESAGKKVYHLTDAGRAAVDDLGAESAPWEEAAAAFPGGGDFHRAAGRLLQAVFQIGKGGSPAQWAAASEVMETARKQLYKILAED